MVRVTRSRTTALLVAAALLLPATPASALDVPCAPGSPIEDCDFTPEPSPGFGWVTGDVPDSPVGEWYTPWALRQANYTDSVARTNRVRHDGPGAYTVYVDRVTGGGGVAHVSALGTGNRGRCKLVTTYPAGSGQYLVVRCDNLAGTPKDSAFTASFTNLRTTAHEFGYRSGVGGAVWAHNSESGAVTTAHEGTGAYRVTFDGLGGEPGGTVQVTATGQSTSWCKVADWYPDEQVSARHVLVRCFTPAGQPVDSEFTTTFVETGSLMGDQVPRPGLRSAYARVMADLTVPAPWTSPRLPAHPFSAQGMKGAAGYLEVVTPLNVVDPLGEGYAHVTATGPDPVSCGTGGWGGNWIYARCFTPAGVTVNAPFTVAYLGAFV